MNNTKFEGNNVFDMIYFIRLAMNDLYFDTNKNDKLYLDLDFMLKYGLDLLESNIKIWSWKFLSQNGKLCDYVYSPDFTFFNEIKDAGCSIDDYKIRR